MTVWAGYRARFSIDFEAHADQIAFVEPLVSVRNPIVTEAPTPNTWLAASSFDDGHVHRRPRPQPANADCPKEIGYSVGFRTA